MVKDDEIQKAVRLIKSIGPFEKAKKESIDTYEFDQLIIYFHQMGDYYIVFDHLDQ